MPLDLPSRRLVLAAPALLLAPTAALAHHGWGSFDRNKTLDHAGPVLRSSYANPHGVVVMRHEAREVTFELAPVFRMQHRGLAEADIAVGRPVRLMGYQNVQTPTLYRAEWIEVRGDRIQLR